MLDPGLGFAKVHDSNWPLLARLDALQALGHRVLVGASRKRFLGAVIAAGDDPAAREHATTAVSVLAAQAGAWALRVHEPRPAKDALAVLGAWQSASERGR